MTKLLDNCVADSLILRILALNLNFSATREQPVHVVCDRSDICSV